MRPKTRRPSSLSPPAAANRATEQSIERLRLERMARDGVTGLPIHPFEEPERIALVERIEHLGVIYLQIGRFFGFEELYGWEQYDRVLALVAEGVRQDFSGSPLQPYLVSIRFSGSDGFYVLFSLPAPGRRRFVPLLEREAGRLREAAAARLRQEFAGSTVDLISVYASSLVAADNPRVRPARHLIRNLSEAAKIVSRYQTWEKQDLCARLKAVLGRKQLKAAFQPVCHLPDGEILGYEALIRGPQGTGLEQPNALFAVAHENDMDVELETLCLETIFEKLPRGLTSRRLFVNASAKLLRHPIFLDPRNLSSINRTHGDVVVEISEKEMVGDYPTFRGILDVVRGANLKIAIDDAGSGYSGLEAILYLKPDYIKVADSLVRHLESDPIKREIITSLASIGRQIRATLVAEGIERSEERAALVELGIPYGQGFLLGRPAFQLSGRRRAAPGH